MHTGLPWCPARTGEGRRRRNTAAIEITLQRKDNTTNVCVVARRGHQTRLTQSRQRVTQLGQPTSQATAGRVTDPHELDQRRRAESALVQIGERLTMAVELNAIKTSGFVQQRPRTTPLAQQRHGLRELHLVIKFREANYITAAAPAIAVEKIVIGIHQEAWFVIGV